MNRPLSNDYAPPPQLELPQDPQADAAPVAESPEVELPQGPQSEDVAAAVDATISPDATVEQRNTAYREVQAYVDRAQGSDHTTIDDDTMRGIAIHVQREHGVPTRYRQEVLDAVDGALSPGASLAQQAQAYAEIQAYVDGVGGLGEAGITAEALPARTAVLLQEAGLPTRRAQGEASGEAVAAALEGDDDAALVAALEGVGDLEDPGYADGFFSAFTPEQLAALDARLADIVSVQPPGGHAGRGEAAQERYQQDLALAEVARGLRSDLVNGYSAASQAGLISVADQRALVEQAEVGTLIAWTSLSDSAPMTDAFLHAVAARLPELPGPIHVNMGENASIETLIGNIAETSPAVAAELLGDPAFASWLIGGERHHRRSGVEREGTAAFITAAATHVAHHGDFATAAEMAILLGGASGNPDAAVQVALAEAVGYLLPRLAEGLDPSNREAMAAQAESSGLLQSLVDAGLLDADADGAAVIDLLKSRLTGIAGLVGENPDARAMLVGAVNAQALLLMSDLSAITDADGNIDTSRLSSITQELREIMAVLGEGLFTRAIDEEAAAAAAQKFIESLVTAPLGASIPALDNAVADRLLKIPGAAIDQTTGSLVESLIGIEPGLTRDEVLAQLDGSIVDYANTLAYQAALANPDLLQAIIADVGVDIAPEDVTLEHLQEWASDAGPPTSTLLRTLQAEFRTAIQDGIADAYIAADAG